MSAPADRNRVRTLAAEYAEIVNSDDMNRRRRACLAALGGTAGACREYLCPSRSETQVLRMGGAMGFLFGSGEEVTDGSVEAPRGVSRSAGTVAWALRGVLVILCLFCLLSWARVTWQRVRYPYEVDYAEGVLLAKAALLAGGVPPYAATTTLPYVPLVYPPLFVALWAPFTVPAGLAFWPGRLIACLGLLLAVACLVRIVRHFRGGWSTCLLAATCFLWLPPVRVWSGLARVDTLSLGLSALGLCVFIVAPARARGWGTLCFILAVLTKQSVLAAPLAAYVALFWSGERRAALRQALLFAAGVGGALAALQLVTGGALLRDIVVGNLLAWSLHALAKGLKDFLQGAPLLLAAALGAVPTALARPQTRVLAIYVALGLAATLMYGKVGAGPNYLLESCFGLVLIFTCVVRPQLGRPLRRGTLNELAVALVFVQLLLVAYPMTPHGPDGDRDTQARLIRLVRALPGEVLGWPMGPIVQAGKTLWIEPDENCQMALAGHWDEAPLRELVRQHYFAAVLMGDSLPATSSVVTDLHTERWSPTMLRVLDREYQITDRVGWVLVLRPRGHAAAGEGAGNGHERRAPL